MTDKHLWNEEAAMRRNTTILAIVICITVFLSGCTKEEIMEKLSPIVEDLAAGEAGTVSVSVPEGEEEVSWPAIPEIDTSVRIHPGARVAVVGRGKKGEYWDAVQHGMKQALKDINTAYGFDKNDQIRLTYEAPESEQDVDGQINMLDSVIAENPDVLCLAACDANSCLAQVEAARENGIPVVTFDSSLHVEEEGLIKAFRGSDNVKIGQIGGYRLALAIGKMGKVALFCGSSKLKSTQDRVKGFADTVAAYGDIKIIATLYSDQTSDMSEAIQEVLASDPNLTGVFCTSAEISELYLNTSKDETLDSVAMVGVDATMRQQSAVRSGEEAGVVSQFPYAIGYQTIFTAVQATASRKSVTIPEEILVEPMWIDRRTIDFKKAEDYLF